MREVTNHGVTTVVRRVVNDVGAAVTGPVRILDWDETVPVVVSILWEGDAEPTQEEGTALAYTRDHVNVSVTDHRSSLQFRPWVRAADVRR